MSEQKTDTALPEGIDAPETDGALGALKATQRVHVKGAVSSMPDAGVGREGATPSGEGHEEMGIGQANRPPSKLPLYALSMCPAPRWVLFSHASDGTGAPPNWNSMRLLGHGTWGPGYQDNILEFRTDGYKLWIADIDPTTGQRYVPGWMERYWFCSNVFADSAGSGNTTRQPGHLLKIAGVGQSAAGEGREEIGIGQAAFYPTAVCLSWQAFNGPMTKPLIQEAIRINSQVRPTGNNPATGTKTDSVVGNRLFQFSTYFIANGSHLTAVVASCVRQAIAGGGAQVHPQRTAGVGDTPVGLGQPAFTCPPDLPPEACTLAQAALLNINQQIAASTPAGQTPQPFDPNTILTQFKEWWSAANPTNPTPPTDPNQYINGSAGNILNALSNWWMSIGSQSPATAASVDPSAWTLPWQYLPPGSGSDPTAAIQGILAGMMADPNAVAQLNQGQVPPFDPTQMNWTTLGQSLPWSDPNTWGPLLNNTAPDAPVLQSFVTGAATCQLFSQGNSAVQTAFTDLVVNGVSPCLGGGGLAPSPTPPSPTGGCPIGTQLVNGQCLPLVPPTPAPGTTPTSATTGTSTTPWGGIVLGGIAVLAAGGIVYLLATGGSKKIAGPAPAAKSPLMSAPRRRARRRR
jgi:hypothetical protein